MEDTDEYDFSALKNSLRSQLGVDLESRGYSPVVLRRCRPWLEAKGPEPLRSDRPTVGERRRKRNARMGRGKPRKELTPQPIIPFGRVMVAGWLFVKCLQKLSNWWAEREARRSRALTVIGPRQVMALNGWGDPVTDLKLYEDREKKRDQQMGMILQQLTAKPGAPLWAQKPVQPELLAAAARSDARPMYRMKAQRRRTNFSWNRLPNLDDVVAGKREVENPPRRPRIHEGRKAAVPYRHMSVVERAARQVATRFDE